MLIIHDDVANGEKYINWDIVFNRVPERLLVPV